MAKQMEAHLHEEFKLWSFVVLCQSKSRMQGGKREKSNMKKFQRTATVGHISSTSWSPFYEYYISFQSSGSQESNCCPSHDHNESFDLHVEFPFIKKWYSTKALFFNLYQGSLLVSNPTRNAQIEIKTKIKENRIKILTK